MSQDLLSRLSETDVPPIPEEFDAEIHQRVNQRLVVSHVLDFAVEGLGYALLAWLEAVAATVGHMFSGQFQSSDRRRRPRRKS